METSQAATCHLRDFSREDSATFNAILTAIWPDEPNAVEQLEHWERTYPADNPRLRRVAALEDGQMVGYGEFRANTLDAPTTNPDAIFIARRAGQMVGMTSLELLSNGVGITGVLAGRRGRGVAMALKLASFRYLRVNGYAESPRPQRHRQPAHPGAEPEVELSPAAGLAGVGEGAVARSWSKPTWFSSGRPRAPWASTVSRWDSGRRP